MLINHDLLHILSTENSQSMDLNLGIAPPSLTGGINDNDTLGNLNEINYILGDMSSHAARTRVIL